MAIHSPKNLYPGVNPHLNSALHRNEQLWSSFRKCFALQLCYTLDRLLPENYYTDLVTSLQFVMIEASIQKDHHAIMIYSSAAKPVARIELLTPKNKPRAFNYEKYQSERSDEIRGSIQQVEIDVIYESRPSLTFATTSLDQDSHPYHVVVTNPYIKPHHARAIIYGFGILDPIPVVKVFLGKEDFVILDVGEVYQTVFEGRRLYWQILTDYSQLPANFDSYTPEDQEQMRQQMKLITAQYGTPES